MGKRPVTQKEIADQLGVSTATVSRVLNDRPGVGLELRQKILQVFSEREYAPNTNARSLATAKTNSIAFVVHKKAQLTQDPFYAIIMAGAEEFLSQRNFHFILATLEDNVMARPETFSVVSQRRVDGLILAGPDISSSFILHQLSRGRPVVLVDNNLSTTPVNALLSDDEGGAYRATRHLVEHGHKCILFLCGPESWVSNRERARGYMRAVEESRCEPLLLHASETTIASGKEMMREGLARWPEITAVCGVNDSVAIGAIRAATGQGRKIPEDIAVIGFDDISWAAINEPPLSTVHVFKKRIGQLAAQCLLDKIENPDEPTTKTIVSVELVLRESCGHK